MAKHSGAGKLNTASVIRILSGSLVVLVVLVFFWPGIREADSRDQQWVCDRRPLLIENTRLPWQPGAREILIEDGRIMAIAASVPRDIPKLRVLDGEGALALPGLIDSHTHFDSLPGAKHLQGRINIKNEIFPMTMRQTLASGVTTARTHLARLDDLAVMAEVSEDSCFPAPRFVLSGPGFLGGAPGVNAPLMRGVGGVADARSQVAEVAGLGAEWLAIHGIARFPDEEIQAILETADALGLRVMADTGGFDDLETSLSLPVSSGEYINRTGANTYPERVLAAIARRDEAFYFVPPLGYYRRTFLYEQEGRFAESLERLPFIWAGLVKDIENSFERAFDEDEYIAAVVASYPTLEQKFAQLRVAGAIPVLGSDSGSLGQFHHDAVWQEMAAWLALGATPADILDGATTAPARMLGRDDVGVLSPGAKADVVLYDGDFESGQFDRNRVLVVIKGGVVFVENRDWIGPDLEQFRTALGFAAQSSD